MHTDLVLRPSLDEVTVAVTASWSAETCHATSAYVAGGRPGDRSRGQCGTTALVLQDFLGGQVLVAQVYIDGRADGVHYWNRLPDGRQVDLTQTQFLPHEVLGVATEVTREPKTVPRRGFDAYLLLLTRVRRHLGVSATTP